MYTLGERPAKLAELEDTVNVLASLFDGEFTTYKGEEIRLKWLQQNAYSPEIPIYVAAEGPKTLELAGQIADGVLIGTGLTPPLIQESLERVATGARKAGKDPADVTTWIMARANVRNSREEAIDEIKIQLAASANHAFRFTLEGKQIPEEHKDAIRTLQDEYDPHDHEALEDGAHHDLVDELGLTDFLAERFAIAGTTEQCIEKLREVSSVDGVDGLFIPAYTNDKESFITRFGNDVFPTV